MQVAARLRLDARKREIQQALTQSYTGLKFGLARWQAMAQAERSAGQSLQGTRKGVQAGTRNIIDVLNAEQALTDIRGQRIALGYQLALTSVELFATTATDAEQALAMSIGR